jgi:hypothetical protein
MLLLCWAAVLPAGTWRVGAAVFQAQEAAGRDQAA